MTDITWVGKVSDISKKSGISSSGNEWTMTNFKFTRIIPTKEGNKEVALFVHTFNSINVENDKIYQIGFDVRNEKNQDGKFELTLSPKFAEKCLIPGQEKEETKPQSSTQRPNYQEDFNDDIPF